MIFNIQHYSTHDGPVKHVDEEPFNCLTALRFRPSLTLQQVKPAVRKFIFCPLTRWVLISMTCLTNPIWHLASR